jgi:hypothetical protein
MPPVALNERSASGHQFRLAFEELELEPTMMIERAVRRCVMTTAMLIAFSLGGALSAVAAETTVYRDVRKPNGQERNMAAKRTDFAACGHPVWVSDHDFPKFRTCMRAHGWVIDHVIPDSSVARFQPRSYDDDQDKINEDASNDAERRSDDQMRNDDFTRNLLQNEQ